MVRLCCVPGVDRSLCPWLEGRIKHEGLSSSPRRSSHVHRLIVDFGNAIHLSTARCHGIFFVTVSKIIPQKERNVLSTPWLTLGNVCLDAFPDQRTVMLAGVCGSHTRRARPLMMRIHRKCFFGMVDITVSPSVLYSTIFIYVTIERVPTISYHVMSTVRKDNEMSRLSSYANPEVLDFNYLQLSPRQVRSIPLSSFIAPPPPPISPYSIAIPQGDE